MQRQTDRQTSRTKKRDNRCGFHAKAVEHGDNDEGQNDITDQTSEEIEQRVVERFILFADAANNRAHPTRNPEADDQDDQRDQYIRGVGKHGVGMTLHAQRLQQIL